MASERVIVYLHGFRSSPASVKARQLARAVEALPASVRPMLHVPKLAGGPAGDVAATVAWIETNVAQPRAQLTLVGSSLGGFYATHLAERFGARAVLVNPAIRPYDDLRPYIGPQVNLYSGETFLVTEAHFDELRRLAVHRITRPDRYLLLVQTGDEVLDYREAIAFYAGAFQFVEGGGDHGFQRFEAQIAPLLRFAGVPLC
jgi:predicted esterase YcpF (UPF0227 family)